MRACVRRACGAVRLLAQACRGSADSIPGRTSRSQVPGSDFRALNREAIKAGSGHTASAQVRYCRASSSRSLRGTVTSFPGLTGPLFFRCAADGLPQGEPEKTGVPPEAGIGAYSHAAAVTTDRVAWNTCCVALAFGRLTCTLLCVCRPLGHRIRRCRVIATRSTCTARHHGAGVRDTACFYSPVCRVGVPVYTTNLSC